MKKDQKNQRKSLRIGSETIRMLNSVQLEEVAGGDTGTRSNNGCTGSTSVGATACHACVR